MWVDKHFAHAIFSRFDAETNRHDEMAAQIHQLLGENERLRTENERLAANQEWFKLRLTQVERERAQLIHAAIGTKVSVPEFVPTYRPDEALNEQSFPFKEVGDISSDPADQIPAQEDYSSMPGYGKTI